MTEDSYNHQLGRIEAEVENLKISLIRLEERLMDRFKRLEDALGGRLNQHSGRIRRLELWRAGVISAMGVILAGLGYLWSVLVRR